MARGTGIHWFVPTVMFGGLVAGTLLAVGHHVFYQNLDGQRVSDGGFLYFPVSRQQANIAIGTALAFLVRACLVFSIGLVFIQLFWAVSQTRRIMKPPTLGRLDSAYGAFDNITALLNFDLWRRYPLLLLLASIAWLVPIASLITPSTLSIRSAAVIPPPTSLTKVPNVDFRSLDFIAIANPSDETPCYTYNGPSSSVSRITNAVMSLGQILPFNFQAVNASWEVSFSGPALKCNHLTGSQRELISNNIFAAEAAEQPLKTYYACWFPNSSGGNASINTTGLAFHKQPSTPEWKFTVGSLIPRTHLDTSFYVAVMPLILPDGYKVLIPDYTSLHCRLLNSTYQMRFDFSDGSQHVSPQVKLMESPKPIQTVGITCLLPNSNSSDLCDSLGRSCFSASEIFQTLSYQSILIAFAEQISGRIHLETSGMVSYSSNVFNTILADTPELSKLRSMESAGLPKLYPWTRLKNPEFLGVSNTNVSILDLSLPEAIEQLFQNVTVSMMTSAALQPNESSFTAPGPVNVTSHKYHNIYVYSAWKLWIPYGIGIGLTLVTIIVGFATILRTSATYSNNFSTIFRAARGATISEEARDEDQNGKDPLPKYLKKSKVWLPGFEEPEHALEPVAYKQVSPLDAPQDVTVPADRTSTDSDLLELNGFNWSGSADRRDPSESTSTPYPTGPDDQTASGQNNANDIRNSGSQVFTPASAPAPSSPG